VINKLAAILRVADALSRGRMYQGRDLRLQRQGDDLIISVPGASDLTLERRALAIRRDLFEDIYGMRVRVEEA
jgi:exopolyphosphatase/guanosine-5'-triphosphate,3'-diphosphate pyrophosphatase